ncbi:hypothetical protein SAMN04488115_104448 [Bosea lathyri]|uniref:Uncharacterized protein n=1 Tax=Bosea lathyri TaxID=1036778 RepID=A0A1H5ZIK7_9HYPH|nr:hypothetical protein SAMN04488115_104448 [Bosea lathyri]
MIEAAANLLAQQRVLDAGQAAQEVANLVMIQIGQDVDTHETAERTMMAHERVGDRADHPCCSNPVARIQPIAEIEDVRRAIGEGQIRHAVIGDDADRGARVDEGPDTLIDGADEGVRFRRAWRMGVLNEIRKREIEQLRPAALQQAKPGIEHEQRKLRRILVGNRPARLGVGAGDPMLRHGTGHRFLCRECDARTALAR